MLDFLLGIDQGTSSIRAFLISTKGEFAHRSQVEYSTIYPDIQWVEQIPEEILKATILTCKEVLNKAKEKGESVKTIGITNQRETTVIWDKKTGKAVYNAIVWQDRRTAEFCNNLIKNGYEKEITKKTGLLIDPYFSATKIKWILDNIEGVKRKAEAGQLLFGTIDTYLLWHLTGGKIHATDATNASRTMLFNLEKQDWDDDILKELGIPKSLLPVVLDSAANFGETDKNVLGYTIPINGILGDQQAAAVGQACFTPGILKCTYGTGCFALMNIGNNPIYSQNRLLTTIAYRLNGVSTYALEGAVFVAGAAVQWLRDKLKVIKVASETEELARSLKNNDGVYIVPAFTGLGAPYWDSTARGVIVGMTRDTGIAHFARAVLEAACYQTYDLYDSMSNDCGIPLMALRVDGGMTENKWMLQFLADISNLTVAKPTITQITAFGAAYMAGLGAGMYNKLEDITDLWRIEAQYEPCIDESTRQKLIRGWRNAVNIAMRFK